MPLRVACALVVVVVASPTLAKMRTPSNSRARSSSSVPQKQVGKQRVDLGGLDPDVFLRAERAWQKARAAGQVRRPRLVVIDYTRPSTQPRLWVFDLDEQKLLFKELVAHGKHTGDNLATRFSNTPGSLQTSLGVFVTADIYRGEHGKSLHLDGLEPGFNDRARERAIVIHAADYVDNKAAQKQGRLGRSWGCPAVRPAVAGALIDAVAGGSLVFAWGNDRAWQQGSRFLR